MMRVLEKEHDRHVAHAYQSKIEQLEAELKVIAPGKKKH
jgi:hypothetical protein